MEPSVWDIIKHVADGLLLLMMTVTGGLIKILHSQNIKRFEEIKSQLEHLDTCIDQQRRDDLGAAKVTIGRPELDDRIQIMQNRMSAELLSHTTVQAAQIGDIIIRIGRIEAHMFRPFKE